LDTNQVMKQSKAAYGQWAPQWREHAKIHSKFKMNSLLDLENTGIGKAILSCANGYSLEENIEVIKENKDKVDILCCDKSLGHLLDNGIEPTYCMVCDANVDYDKYLLKWKDKLKNTILLINVCANPKWTEGIEWKKIYFFINKDIIQSELEFRSVYAKLNHLISQVYPDYSSTYGVMRAPMIRLTIGDYLHRVAGLLENVNVTVDNNYPWEINKDNSKDLKQLPQVINVECSFKPIQDFVPRRINTANPNVPYITEQNQNYLDNLIFTRQVEIVPSPSELPPSQINEGTQIDLVGGNTTNSFITSYN